MPIKLLNPKRYYSKFRIIVKLHIVKNNKQKIEQGPLVAHNKGALKNRGIMAGIVEWKTAPRLFSHKNSSIPAITSPDISYRIVAREPGTP